MPFNRLARREIDLVGNPARLGFRLEGRQLDPRDMPPVYIVRIRRVEQRSLVWRQLYLFHIKISRRQQVSFPPAAWEMDFLKIGIEDVKMVTSILLGAEDNPAVPGKLQRLSRKRRQ